MDRDEDVGAVGLAGKREKDITLAIATISGRMPAPRITCCSVLPWAESAGGTAWRVGWTGAGCPVAMRVGTPVATVVGADDTVVGTDDDGVAAFAAPPP